MKPKNISLYSVDLRRRNQQRKKKSSLRYDQDQERESSFARDKRVSRSDDLGDFPGGAVVENPPANAGDTGLSPGLERPHMPRSN